MVRPKKISVEDNTDSSSIITADNKKLEELEFQIKELQRTIDILLSVKSNTKENIHDDEEDDETNKIKITSDDYIKVMSLTPYFLYLSTQAKGNGKTFLFKNFGEVKRILYHDLVLIMENHQSFLENGFFIILNRSVVRKHGLDEVYSKILTKERIEKIVFGENQSDAVNLFKSANLSQQQIIVNLIIDKVLNGFIIDLNLLDRLSRVTGYSISERIESIKVNQKILENKN